MRLPFSNRTPKTPVLEDEELHSEETPKEKLRFSDHFLILGTAFLWIFLPCVLILLAISFLVMLVFGLL